MSKFRFIFIVVAVLLVSTVASSQPTAAPSPSPTPTKKKVTPTPAPVTVPTSSPASPPTEYVAPSPSTIADSPTEGTQDCTTLLLGTADCLSYVMAGSNLTVPETACCPELATLVRTSPICLCQLLKKGGTSFGDIDMTRALALPAACKVVTPDPSLCALVNGSGSPAEAPGSVSPEAGSGPSGSAVPSSANDNGVSSIGISATNFVLTLMAAAAFTWNMY